MAKLTVTIPAVDVIVDGVTYRKVDRKAQAGDIIKALERGADIEPGAFYNVISADTFSDAANDGRPLSSWEHEVYAPVADAPVSGITYVGAQYRKVYRSAREGDAIVFTDELELPGYLTLDKPYHVTRIDGADDAHVEDNDGDDFDTCGHTFDVYETVTEVTQAPVEYREVKRPADVGERIKIVERLFSSDPYENGDELTVSKRLDSERISVEVRSKTAIVRDEEYIVLEPVASAVTTQPKRLTIGDYAKVITSAGRHGCAVGSVVKISVDDRSAMPYRAEKADGTSGGWMFESNVVPATEAEFLAQKKPAEPVRLAVGAYAKITSFDGAYTSGVSVGLIVKIAQTDSSQRPYYAEKLDGSRAGWFKPEQLTLATPEEVAEGQRKAKEAQETAKWSTIGREVNEFKRGDIVSIVKKSGEKGVGTVEEAFGPGSAIGVRMGAKVWDGSEFHGVFFDEGDTATLIVPAEQRFDTAAEAA